MKKVRFFWGFCMLAALLICGAVHACAEREVTYNADDMTVTYSETEMTVRNNGTAYFAVYDKNRLIAISTKEVGRSDSSVSLTVDVNAEPCLGKVFMFDSDLKPMAEVVVLDNKDDFLVIKNSVVTKTVTKNFENYDETTGIFEYYADLNDAKTSKILVDTNNLSVYYNDSLMSIEDISVLGGLKNILLDLADSITFKGLKDGKFDKIYVTDYAYQQVAAVKTDEKYVKFTIDGFSLNPEDRSDHFFVYNLYDADGNTMTLADVKEGDIFNIIAPLYNGSMNDFDNVPYMDIYVSRKTVNGVVDEEIETGYKYKINGEEYELDSNADIKVGDEGVFYLTIDGKIYCSDAVSTLKKNCSFIAAYGNEVSFGERIHQLKLFTGSGAFEIYSVAATVKVYEGNVFSIYKRSDKTQDTFFAEIEDLVADETTEDAAKAKLGRRMVTFKVNSDNEISELRFAATGSDFLVSLRGSAKYYKDAQMFGGWDLDNNSKLFVAPVTELAAGAHNVNKDDLRTGPFSSLDANKTGGYAAYLYSFAGEDYLGAALICETVEGLIDVPDSNPDSDDTTISKNCSFIVAYSCDTSFGVNLHQLKLFTGSGAFEIYSVAATVKVYEGNEYKTYKRSDETQDAFFNSVVALVADETTENAAKAKLGRRMVTFKVNSDNEISELRFAAEGAAFSVASNSSAKYNGILQSFGGQNLDENSKLFVTPVTKLYNDCYNVDEDDLRIVPFSSVDEDAVYSAFLFSFKEDPCLAAALVDEEIYPSMKRAHLAVVKTRSIGLDAEGFAIDKYTFVQSGEIITKDVDYDAMSKVEEMDTGDVFRYSVNADGEIVKTHLIYTANTRTFDPGEFSYENYDLNQSAILYGKVTEVRSDRMTIDSSLVFRFIESTENTYALIDEAKLTNSDKSAAVKVLAGPSSLIESYGSLEYYVITVIDEAERYEDCVQVRRS